MKGRSNSSSRRLSLTISTSSTMNDFINKKLGVTKDNKRPILIKPTKK
ncbi:hypothetical protein elemo103D_phanotate44 [Flavobacterium phage vB_FspP_elemoE_10-3D]|nr:hypothetical protein elemo103D_phanotate44 [Flavobacterium phage vB_FspP_elemoE_10-3D]